MVAKSAYLSIYETLCLSDEYYYFDTMQHSARGIFIYGKPSDEDLNLSSINNDSIKQNHIISIEQFDKVKGEKIQENSYGSQIMLVGLTLIFFIIANVIKLHSKDFISFFSFKENKEENNKVVTINELALKYILILGSFFIFSIAIYQSFILYFDNKGLSNNWSIYTLCIFWLIIILFSLIKFIIYKAYSYIFSLKKEINDWTKLLIDKLNLIGILCFIPILFIFFTPINNIILILIMGVLFIYGQIYIFGNLMFLFIEKKYDFLYLIMYLCTIEFLPYVFLIYWLAQIFKLQVILY